MKLLLHYPLVALKIKASVILQACYIFIMEKMNQVFYIFRDFSSSKQVEKYLKFEEECAAESKLLGKLTIQIFISSTSIFCINGSIQSNLFFQVLVFNKTGPITPFTFLFKKFTLKMSPGGLGLNNNFNRVQEDIETELSYSRRYHKKTIYKKLYKFRYKW